MKNRDYFKYLQNSIQRLFALMLTTLCFVGTASGGSISDVPLFVSRMADPIAMLTMSKDHQLYKKAYSDYDDVDGDGQIDNGYDDGIDYYGYFDSRKCYTYNSGRFEPSSAVSGSSNHECDGTKWSGNFLNWASMTRMDVLRRALYGGKRYTDSNTETVLERAYIPPDIHAFSKVYAPAGGAADVNKFTPYSDVSISICNVSNHTGTTESQNLSLSGTPPVMRVASGKWPVWAAGEVSQCSWGSGTPSNAPSTTDQKVQLNARVQVCVTGLLESNCQSYPNGNRKPTGLLQSFGVNTQGESTIKFGLLTGSYESNLSGGILRKNPGFISGNTSSSNDEVDTNTGKFINQGSGNEGIINTLNRLRISKYRPSKYNDCNTHSIALPDESSSTRNCGNWGNPLGEMYLETLRYLAGNGNSPTSPFDVNDATNYISGIPSPSWTDPYTSDNWCAVPSVVLISTGLNSFDEDQYSTASDIPGISGKNTIDTLTDTIGTQEGIHGNSYFVGENGTTNNGLCTAKTVNSLADVEGLCPEDPSLEGTFSVAGLALHAHTENLRPDVTPTGEEVNVNTYSLALAQGLPRITLNGISFVPTCQSSTNADTDWANTSEFTAWLTSGAPGTTWLNCSPADLRIRDITFDSSGNLVSGEVVIVWEDSSWGNDYDKDGIQHLQFCAGSACSPAISANQVKMISSNPNHAAGNSLRYGYAIAGSTNDGLEYNIGLPRGSAARDCLASDLSLNSSCTAFTEATIGAFSKSNGSHYTQDTEIWTAGSSPASLLNPPIWYAAKYGSFTEASTIPNDLPDETFEWDSDNNGVPDNYFNVTNPSELESQLSKVFQSILETSGSASAVASNTTTLQTDTEIFQAVFDSGVWTGDVIAIPINSDGSLGTPTWSAATEIDGQGYSGGRKIVTFDPAATPSPVGIPFRWTDLNSTQQTALNTNPVTGTADGRGEDRANYVRGDRTNEVGKPGLNANFRARSSVLGDIVDSTPYYAGAPVSGYLDTLESADYSTFASNNASRTPMLYLGANDGMLHAINATTGEEQFAYVPNEVIANLAELTDPGYNHRFFVNASPTAADAYFDGAWHTVLVSGLGAGGKAMFALDVTDPDTFTEGVASARVLWEISSTSTGFSDLGYTYSQPSVVKLGLSGGDWAAIFGNGYNSANDKAILYIVNIKTGALIASIEAPGNSSLSNGLSTPSVIDINGDQIADTVYAGDLQGNLWRFDISGSSTGSYSVTKLFAAINDDATPASQPIVTEIEVGKDLVNNSSAGTMVYFGTGKYYEDDDVDVANAVTESFYGIVDDGSGSTVSRADLLEQTIDIEDTFIFPDTGAGIPVEDRTFDIRITSNNSLQVGDMGWYMDLVSPVNGFEGERVVTDATLRNGRIIFTTLIPSESSCDGGGSGWLMELDAQDGSRLANTFDLNNDGEIDDYDFYTDSNGNVNYVVSGKKSKVGIPQEPTIIGAGEIEYKYVSGSSSGSSGVSVEVTTEDSGTSVTGRLSWQQLK